MNGSKSKQCMIHNFQNQNDNLTIALITYKILTCFFMFLSFEISKVG